MFLLKFKKKQGTLGWQNYLFFKLFLYKFINTEQKSDLNSACLKKKKWHLKFRVVTNTNVIMVNDRVNRKTGFFWPKHCLVNISLSIPYLVIELDFLPYQATCWFVLKYIFLVFFWKINVLYTHHFIYPSFLLDSHVVITTCQIFYINGKRVQNRFWKSTVKFNFSFFSTEGKRYKSEYVYDSIYSMSKSDYKKEQFQYWYFDACMPEQCRLCRREMMRNMKLIPYNIS